MRAALLSLLLVAPLFAGCLSATVDPASTDVPTDLVLSSVPEGARVEPVAGGLKLVWEAVDLPFETTVAIPAGATLVRATGVVGPDQFVGVTMRHAETDRRRCNFASVEAWDTRVLERASCSGVTAVDRLPDEWKVRASGEGPAKLVEVEFLAAPVDGLLAHLDLTQLSQREHALLPTEVLDVPSFDGTPLRIEVTLPEGPGPWPTILWSSPYNHADRLGGEPAAWRYFVRDWAERGYAIVSADVRGYGESGGCVEVWSTNEQKDQVFLVEWVAKQEWSDGNVGFYGQSYVATTPVEAAVHAPEALKAIVIVAPVNDAYQDWHFGGVPNGENTLSPVGYQAIGLEAATDPADPLRSALNAANGLCDPTLAARASDPRALYDAFYEERNFSARAGDVKAAVLYTQGFEDSNVKSQMIPDWFNAITAPKLGLFGHWLHQHPTRADNEALMLGWMDQHVKGKALGFEKLPAVDVVTNVGTQRAASEWPPVSGFGTFAAYPSFDDGALQGEPAEGAKAILLEPLGYGPLGFFPVAPLSTLPLQKLISLDGAPLVEPVHFAGQGVVELTATLQGAENGYVAAYLYETSDEGAKLVTWGMVNLAHRNGHDQYAPVAPGETVRVALPLLPTEWVFRAGTSLHLELRGAALSDWSSVQPGQPAVLEVHGGEKGTRLALPTVDGTTGVTPLAATAQR